MILPVQDHTLGPPGLVESSSLLPGEENEYGSDSAPWLFVLTFGQPGPWNLLGLFDLCFLFVPESPGLSLSASGDAASFFLRMLQRRKPWNHGH